MTEITVDDVGIAEDWLTREIQKLRSYENATRILQTYRFVKAQLPQLVQEKDVLEKEVIETRKALNGLVKEYNEELEVQIHRVAYDVATRKQELETELAETIQGIDQNHDALQHVLADLQTCREERQEVLQGLDNEIAEKHKQLEALKKEHALLVEAFQRSAAVFSGEGR